MDQKQQYEEEIKALEHKSKTFYTAGLTLVIVSSIVAVLTLIWYLVITIYFSMAYANTGAFPWYAIMQMVVSMALFVIASIALEGGIALLVVRIAVFRTKINNRRAHLKD